MQVRAANTCNDPNIDKEFLNDIGQIGSWQSFYKFYEKFQPCGDDGVFAEGFSDTTVALFTAHWNQLHDLNLLVHAHSDFEKFVLSHLDGMMSQDDSKKIRSQATKQCSKAERELCQAITDQLDIVDPETSPDKQ
jgi:hypothetical protein